MALFISTCNFTHAFLIFLLAGQWTPIQIFISASKVAEILWSTRFVCWSICPRDILESPKQILIILRESKVWANKNSFDLEVDLHNDNEGLCRTVFSFTPLVCTARWWTHWLTHSGGWAMLCYRGGGLTLCSAGQPLFSFENRPVLQLSFRIMHKI